MTYCIKGIDSAWNMWSRSDGCGRQWHERFLDLYDSSGCQTCILDTSPIEHDGSDSVRFFRDHVLYTEGCEMLIRRVFAFVLSHEAYENTGEIRRCDSMFARLDIRAQQEVFIYKFVKYLNDQLHTTNYADPGREVEKILEREVYLC